MSTYDPIRLASDLGLLVDELHRWTGAAREVIHTAERGYGQAAEQSSRIVQQARLVSDQAYQDTELVAQLDTELARLEETAADASQRSGRFVELGSSAVGIAKEAHMYWQGELNVAREWLKRAEHRLAIAIQAFEKAVELVRHCERDVAIAEARLNNCRSQSGRNCSGPARDLEATIYRLREAIELLNLAEAEVVAARDDVAAAQARVAGCEGAVAFCKQAMETANEARKTTLEAKAQTDQAHAYVEAARKLWNTVQKLAQREQEIADDLLHEVTQLERTIDTARNYLHRAVGSGENAQRYAIDARREIDYRADQLLILSRRRVS